MPSVHVITRTTRNGSKRYFVRYRIGGRESGLRHGGTFVTMREATERVRWIGGELAARRVPDLRLATPEPQAPLVEVAESYDHIDGEEVSLIVGRFGFDTAGEPTEVDFLRLIGSITEALQYEAASRLQGEIDSFDDDDELTVGG